MSVEKALDRCIQCGFCLTACPTYRLMGDEESSPRGRIALVKAIVQDGAPADAKSLSTFSECLGCRACETACPSGVPYESILLFGREALAKVSDPLPWPARGLLWTIRSRWRLRLAARLWHVLGKAVIRFARLFRPSTPPFALLAALPDPEPAVVSETPPSPEAALHRGCLMDVFFSGTNARGQALLTSRGLPTGWLPEGLCCGALHAHQGDPETARRLAKAVILAHEASGARTLLNLAGGCSAFLKGYPELFPEGDPWHERARHLSEAVRDVASLVVEGGSAPGHSEGVLTYQDSCHLRHGLGIVKEPREILSGLGEYRELPSAASCCGSAGIYNMIRPDISGRIIRDKVEEALALGAQVVVTSNPGCLLQWKVGVRQAGADLEVRHLVDQLVQDWP